MILSGKEILKRKDQDIIIEPFNENQINPNSYNLRLHNEFNAVFRKVSELCSTTVDELSS